MDNDKFCREALNKLLQAVSPEPGSFIDGKFVNGKLVAGDIYEGLDRLSSSTVVQQQTGVRRDGSREIITA